MASELLKADDANLPAPASIALAVAVVRSKPPDLSIGDYIDQINDSFYVAADRRNRIEYGSAAYWKAEYDRAISDKLDMEDEILRLREEVEALKIGGNRSASPIKPAKANTQTKRQNLQKPRLTEDDNFQSKADDNPDVTALLRHLRALGHRQAAPNSNHFTSRLAGACVYLNKLILQPEELAPRMSAICECLYSTLVRMHDSPDVDDDQFNKSCSRVVQVFQTALNVFHQTAVTRIAEREEEQKRKKHRSNSKVTKSTSAENEQNCKDLLHSLTKIMSNMFRRIDIDQHSHHWLYEGLASIILDYIGSTISYIVFFDPETAEEGLAPVEGLADYAGLDPGRVIATAELAAPYLMAVLRVTLERVRTNTPEPKKETDKMQHKLLHNIEQRLQHTLMRGIFGDDDEKFDNAFWRAEEVDPPVEHEEVEENESEQFVGQVWELLGWDTLAGRCSIATKAQVN